MNEKSISMCQGKGSLSHNNRNFSAKNIDSSRTADNIVFVQQDLSEAYKKIFGDAIEKYNARQKRNDRKIYDYFQHLFNRSPGTSVVTGTNKQKSFYEDLVQIGTKDDTGVGSSDAKVAADCLKEYMEGFQKRNPNFYVFNAVMHLDEATPHLHIDYIPVGHFNKGIDTRNAMAKALEEMGHGSGANAINRWRLSEWEVLRKICSKHGIDISEPKKSRGYSFAAQEYGEHKDRIRELKLEETKINNKISEKLSETEELNKDYENKLARLNEILNYIPDYENEGKIESKCISIGQEIKEMLSGKLSIMKHKDEIIEKIQKLCKLVKQINDNLYKSSDTVFVLREEYSKCLKERDSLKEQIKISESLYTELKNESSELQAQMKENTELVSLLMRYAPIEYAKIKEIHRNICQQPNNETEKSLDKKMRPDQDIEL